MNATSFRIVWVACLFGLLVTSPVIAQTDVGKGANVLSQPMPSINYSRKFAVIVGINYTDNKGVAPLNNAENDAKNLAEVLIRYYGYNPDDIWLGLGDQKGAGDPDLATHSLHVATHSNLTAVLKSIGESRWIAPEIQGNTGKADDTFADDTLKISTDDSVLFFFSGHGTQRSIGGNKKFQILPSDAIITADKPVPQDIDGADILAALAACQARHRLVILDCCHAGGVFETNVVLQEATTTRDAGTFYNRDFNAAFQSRGIQAMVAAHALETAPDGTGSNSPFSDALLKSLKTFPRYWQSEPYTVRQLFRRMEYVFPIARRQSPELRWLDADQGDFHFIPNRNESFEDTEDVDIRLRKLLIAMAPGINGNWWFEDAPWMIPAMREEIIMRLEAGRSPDVNDVQISELYNAAKKYKQDLERKESLGQSETNLSELEVLRLSHMRQMLQFRDVERNSALTNILSDFEAVSSPPVAGNGKTPKVQPALEAVDLHFKAVVAHRLADLSSRDDQDKVSRYYIEALDKYARELENLVGEPSVAGHNTEKMRDGGLPCNTTRALQSLCYSDYSYFLSSSRVPDDRAALENAQRARDNLGGVSLPPIDIFLICRESQCLFRLGMWGAANDRLDTMEATAREMAKQSGKSPQPLVAWAYKERAWVWMDQWNISAAEKLFEDARDHLGPLTGTLADAPAGSKDGESLPVDYDAVVAYLHNEHGLAIARRYSGDSNAAANTYASLIKRIREQRQRHIDATKNSSDTSHSFSEIQGRLVERLVNSLERRGDCGLFGDPQNLVQADDDYRLALREWVQLPTRDLARRAGIADRRALVLALPSAVQDIELSRSLLNSADEWSGDDFSLSILRQTIANGQPVKVRMHGLLADSVLQILGSKDEDRKSAMEELRLMLDVQSREGLISRSIARDNLEALLFGCRLLVEFDLHEMGSDRAKVYADVELLTNLCRLINRGPSRNEYSQITISEQEDSQDDVDTLNVERAANDSVASVYAPPKAATTEQPSPYGKGSSVVSLQSQTSVGLRRFLRPYYDLAIEAHVNLKGKHVRGAIEVIEESLSGPSLALRSKGPRLYFYNTPRAAYLLMDVPDEVSNVYVVANSSCAERARYASFNGKSLLPLPSDFVADWKRLSQESRDVLTGELETADSAYVCWRDDVQGIGCTPAPDTIRSSRDRTVQLKMPSEYCFPLDLSQIGVVPLNEPASGGISASIPSPSAADTVKSE